MGKSFVLVEHQHKEGLSAGSRVFTMKNFDIPSHYRSNFISRIKAARREIDPRKKDFSPTELDFGSVKFFLARHFGFCYGVENAIEIAYKTLEENPKRRIFLLSEMIHNPAVNNDLQDRGIKFIMDTSGNQYVKWSDISREDIVIIPAFGTTLETEKKLEQIGVDTRTYNTTCPFVEKVWNRAASLGQGNFTIIIHGKHYHEETRATFSHSRSNAPSVIIRDINEAQLLCKIILGEMGKDKFFDLFRGKYSEGFNPEKDLTKIGVVNQTTMLAGETQAIADEFRNTMLQKYGAHNLSEHFADTRDTLCYATNDNQQATLGLLEAEADIAIVVGGYNSSNTSHIVELLQNKFPTYFISGGDKIINKDKILSFDINKKREIEAEGFLPESIPAKIALTSGASCPDSIVDDVFNKLRGFFEISRTPEEVLTALIR